MRIPLYRTTGFTRYVQPNGEGSVIIDYDPDYDNTMVSGQEDRFFVSGEFMDTSNFESVGVEKGQNTNTGATTFTLSGLTPGRQYYLFGARHASTDAGAAKTGDYSTCEIFFCPIFEPRVFPANTTKTYDPATDDLFDVFALDGQYKHIIIEKGSDAEMGNYWRVKGDPASVGISNIDNATSVQWQGLDYISPRHNFSIEFNIRHNGDTTGATTKEQQFQAGFRSGDQYQVCMDYYRPHSNDVSGDWPFYAGGVNWAPAYDPYNTASYSRSNNYQVNFQVPNKQITYPGGVDIDAKWRWLLHMNGNHSNYSDRTWITRDTGGAGTGTNNDPVANKIRWDYNAGTYEFKAYLNDVLVLTLGDEEKPLLVRRRHLHGQHLASPISLMMWTQKLGGEFLSSGEHRYVDFGEIKITTESPYAFAGWACGRGPATSIYGYPWVSDGAGNTIDIYFVDPTAHTIDSNQVDTFQPSSPSRFAVDNMGGVLVSHPTSMDGDGGCWPFEYINGFDWTGVSNRTKTFLCEAVTVPANHAFHSAFFHGHSKHGTAKGRISNSSGGTGLTAYTNALAMGSPEVENSIADASVVRPQWQLFWSYDSAEGNPYFEEGATPSLAVAAGMYFQPFEVTATRTGNTLSITSWGGASIYYKTDGTATFTNSGLETLNLDVSGYYRVTYYASDGSASTAEETVWVGKGIKQLNGTNFEKIMKPPAIQTGGVIKRV